jgi:hypothetical protein
MGLKGVQEIVHEVKFALCSRGKPKRCKRVLVRPQKGIRYMEIARVGDGIS